MTVPWRRWADVLRQDPGPAPDPRLGADLRTVDDVVTWLSHPSNWSRGSVYIVRWDGHVPRLAADHVWKLAPGSYSRELLAQVILQEQERRRRGGRNGEDVRDEGRQEVPDL